MYNKSKPKKGDKYWCWNWLQGEWMLLFYEWDDNRWDRKIFDNQVLYYNKEAAIKEKPKMNPFEAIDVNTKGYTKKAFE